MIQSPDRRHSDSIKWALFGDEVLPLWVADMDFTSPPEVITALQERVAHGVFGYACESKELKEIITARMEDLYQWRITPDDVILLPGVVAGFNLVCQAVTRAGESILMQPPVYPPFFKAPKYTEARAIYNPINKDERGDYRVDLDAFAKVIEEDTRLFLMCNPHNPIGRVYSREELQGMAEICLRRGMVICSDEIHSDLVYSGYQHTPIAALDPEIAAITATLIAPSKTYNIAGLECSALICTNPELKNRIQRARRGLLGGINLLGASAGVAAYRYGDAWLREVLQILEGNRDYLMNFLAEKIPQIKMTKPEATYLAWMDCRDLDLPTSPAKYFLERAKVGLNEGGEFGEQGNGFVRLNFGCSRATLNQALERLLRAL
ncbi:MAG: PatB family C-S lyase [Anaerolineaceae bacterium]|jgi:cystathionine beta-lyase